MLLNLLSNSAAGLDSICIGWDTHPASFTPLTSLTLKVLLNATQKVKCLKELGHTQSVGDKGQSSYKVP